MTFEHQVASRIANPPVKLPGLGLMQVIKASQAPPPRPVKKAAPTPA